MRRLMLAAVAAAAVIAPAGAADAAACNTVVVAGTRIGYCAGFTCQDHCDWDAYIVCEPAAMKVTPCGIIT